MYVQVHITIWRMDCDGLQYNNNIICIFYLYIKIRTRAQRM
jgi:hypothetical protein